MQPGSRSQLPPQQQYQQPVPYAQPPQYPYYQPPAGPPKRNRHLVIIVIVLVVVGVVGVAAAALILRGPTMTITNFQLTDQRSCLFGSGGDVAVTLDLVNTGGNGFAVIAYTLDGITDHTNQYHVPGGTSLPVHDSVFVSDCNAHTVAAQITSEFAG